MNFHRICYPEVPGQLQFVIPKGHRLDDVFSHVPRFRGIFSDPNNIFSEFMFKEGAFNWTLVTVPVLPQGNTNNTTCLKLMTQNEADLQIGMTEIYQRRVDDVDIIADFSQDHIFFCHPTSLTTEPTPKTSFCHRYLHFHWDFGSAFL